MFSGSVTFLTVLYLKASFPMDVKPKKKRNSSKESIFELLKTVPKVVTEAASVTLNLPSSSVSQLDTQILSVSGSANSIFTIFSCIRSKFFHPVQLLYNEVLPAGT